MSSPSLAVAVVLSQAKSASLIMVYYFATNYQSSIVVCSK